MSRLRQPDDRSSPIRRRGGSPVLNQHPRPRGPVLRVVRSPHTFGPRNPDLPPHILPRSAQRACPAAELARAPLLAQHRGDARSRSAEICPPERRAHGRRGSVNRYHHRPALSIRRMRVGCAPSRMRDHRLHCPAGTSSRACLAPATSASHFPVRSAVQGTVAPAAARAASVVIIAPAGVKSAALRTVRLLQFVRVEASCSRSSARADCASTGRPLGCRSCRRCIR